MFHLRGSNWGPFPLPQFLREQLDENGFSPDDAGRCARLLGEQAPGTEAAASLFADLGSCKFLEADIDGAIAAWRHAITSGHDAAAARSLLNLGLLHEHLHLHDRALGLLGRAVDLDVAPYVVPAAMASARCQVAIGDGDLAMETMARLAQRVMASGSDGPELSEALYGLGDIAERSGRPDRADRAWRAAMVSGVADIQHASMERLARLLLVGGHDHAAFQVLSTKDFAVNDADPVFLDAAERFLQRGETDLAVDVLARAHGAHYEPGDRFRLADAKMSCGQVNGAIDELEALLADSDEQIQVRALFTLGQVYASHDMIDPAVSMLERVVAAHDDYWSGAAHLALGDVNVTAGNAEAATSHWTHAADHGVPGVADQARARLAGQAAATSSQGLPSELVAAAPDAAIASSLVSEVEVSEVEVPELVVLADAQLISLDSLDDVIDVRDATHAALISDGPEPEPAEPQLISLDVLEPEAETVSSSDALPDDEPVVVVLEALESDRQPTAPADTAPADTTPADTTREDAATEDNGGEDSGSEDNGSEDNGSERATANAADAIDSSSDLVTATSPLTAPSTTSAFASHLDEPNPYAALAPDHDSNDVKPTARNPYAELAPNFDDAEPPPDVEPGDWESMLEDWPRGKPDPKPKKLPSAFSRYT